MNDQDIALARVLRGVGHAARVWMVRELRAADEPLSASRLHLLLDEGGVSLGAVAYHAHELYAAGLLEEAALVQRRGAIERFYRLSSSGRFIARLLAQLDEEQLAELQSPA